MGSLFATQTGLPFAFPGIQNNISKVAYSLAPSLTGLGDILEENGYHQEFLCGSDIKFAGRDLLFRDHGNFEIYDHFTAMEQGVIPDGYKVWWGFEDYRLYDIAKSELQILSQQDEPFNLTMLTVDTHHVGGYICPRCPDTYDDQLSNVLACTDQLLFEFIQWIQEQPFYEDTAIVITGDHPRMDTYLVGGLPYYDRTVYNCFINAVPQATNTKNRHFSAMDIFPTTLAALGFEIDGDRLGMGTNLFSSTPTLVEELSLDFWDTELQKHSDYYVEEFSH